MSGNKPSTPGHGHGAGHGSGDDHGHAAQVEDQIDFSKVIIVGVVSLVAFALCTLWAVKILEHETVKLHDAQGPSRKATEIGKEEIGIVDQVPFDSDTRLERWQKEKSDALNSYGWVDHKRGIARMPIDKAMEQIAAGAVPPPPAAPAGGTR